MFIIVMQVFEGGPSLMMQHMGPGCRGNFHRNDSVDTAGSQGGTHFLGVPKSDSPGLLAVPTGGHGSQYLSLSIIIYSIILHLFIIH